MAPFLNPPTFGDFLSMLNLTFVRSYIIVSPCYTFVTQMHQPFLPVFFKIKPMTSGNNAFKIFAVVLAVTLAVSLIAYRQYNAAPPDPRPMLGGSKSDVVFDPQDGQPPISQPADPEEPTYHFSPKSAPSIRTRDLTPQSRPTERPGALPPATQPASTTSPALLGGSKSKAVIQPSDIKSSTTQPANPRFFPGSKSAPVFKSTEEDFPSSSDKPAIKPSASQPATE